MDPTTRFSNRVDDYVRYRPGYPPGVIDDLVQAGILSADSVVADVGSGTGLLTELFLRQGNRVYGVEPNTEMRRAGELQLATYPHFVSINGAAELIPLADASVDLVVAGQAFHWFDRARAKYEWARILRPPAWAVLVWNDRLTDATPFLADYERLLQRFATDYAAVDHKKITDEVIADFFSPNGFVLRTYTNRQVFDLAGVTGRLLSSSYAPAAGQPGHEAMVRELRAIFGKHQAGGKVAFEYSTKTYAGRLSRI